LAGERDGERTTLLLQDVGPTLCDRGINFPDLSLERRRVVPSNALGKRTTLRVIPCLACRLQIMDIVIALHHLGTHHNDVREENMGIGEDGRYILFDFSEASMEPDCDDLKTCQQLFRRGQLCVF
jgi:hypothetical protein